MASKQLTATVRLNTTQAINALNTLHNKINSINGALNRNQSDNLSKNLNKSSTAANKVRRGVNNVTTSTTRASTQTNRVKAIWDRISSLGTTVKSKVTNVTSKVRGWWASQQLVNTSLRTTSSWLTTIGSKLRLLASTYLGILGAKAVVNVSDTLTAAENKLNYVNAQNLGSKGTNADGTYSSTTFKATQESLDKMYVASQRVRMSYSDMMSNVAKSMTLAGDAFDNNTDKAIRFQEIMAEAYAVGGATAQEMSTSMYQLIQGLSGNLLAGDELRSVREGAPLAYKEIEKFAQKVYNSEESLKDLASQGLITADIVTAAILGVGDKMDSAFAQTEQTMAQTWDQIKNTAMYAFKPIAKSLSTSLNDALDNGLIKKIETISAYGLQVIKIVFKAIKGFVSWVADSWDWLKYIIIGGLIIYMTYTITATVLSIKAAFLRLKAWLLESTAILKMGLCIGLVMIAIVALIYVFFQWKKGAIDTGEAILQVLTIIAIAFIALGLITHHTWMIALGIVLLVIVAIANSSSNLCDFLINLMSFVVKAICAAMVVVLAVYLATGTVMLSVPVLIALLVVGILAFLIGVFIQFTGQIVGGAYGIASTFKTICHNIGVFFNNLWFGATSVFWNFIGDVLSGLSSLEPAFNAIADLFGLEGITLSGLTQTAYDKAEAAKGKFKTYDDISDAWNTAYAEGYAVGEGIQNKINGFGDKIKNFGSQFQIGADSGSLLDNLKSALGFDDLITFPTEGVGNLTSDFDPSKALGNIDDNTSKMASAMDLTAEDVEYLRKIAALEWKKEYTIADISVNMTNNNTINGESDLDGIVTRLTDKLYEELNEVADGVYAY